MILIHIVQRLHFRTCMITFLLKHTVECRENPVFAVEEENCLPHCNRLEQFVVSNLMTL